VVAAAASFFAASLAAPEAAHARIIYLNPNWFSPAYAEDPSGVSVTFINGDSASHQVVSYRVYGSQAWSLDITLAPWESYTVPEPFYCGGCGISATYLFREPSQSHVVVGWGYSYCSGYCGKLVVLR
jgi:hypothetical protein